MLSAQLLVVAGWRRCTTGTAAEPVWVDSLMRWSDDLLSRYAEGAIDAASPGRCRKDTDTTKFRILSGVVRPG